MGLHLPHVSGVVLVCVVMLLRVNSVVNAAPASETFINFLNIAPECSMTSVRGLLSESDRCLYAEPIRFKENATGPVFSFSTKFVAALDLRPPNQSQLGYGGSARNALEGFTFALLPHPNASVGGDGGYLGLLNATSNGDPEAHTFAVEFDLVESPQFSDPDGGFHIGIDINSMNSTHWVSLQAPSDFRHVLLLQVSIDYDASSQFLNVTAADVFERNCPFTDEERLKIMLPLATEQGISCSSLSVQVDLSNVLNEHMYVGFTSTVNVPQLGDPYAVPDLLGIRLWSLRTSSWPVAPSASLPCYNYSLDPFQSVFRLHPFEVRLSVILVSLSVMAVIYALLYKCYSRWVERRGWRFKIDPDDLGEADPHKFTYKEVAIATKNFDPKQALGRGGFGSVYKGFLPGNKQYVAVKRVAPDSNQGEREFLAEVMIIGKIRHRNLVRLQGWCHERGELLLVYDYMPQGSLDKHLFGSPFSATVDLPNAGDQQGVGKLVETKVVVRLSWERRFKVVVDVAKALVYLHTECEECIIHRDVKAANIMLDAKFNARLGDFGLARSYNHSSLTPKSTNVAGTFGYFAPELFHTFKQTEQTDVYSFGAFLMEVACEKKPIHHKGGEVKLLLDQVWQLWGSSRILDAADEHLAGMFDVEEMTKVLCLGLLCSHPNSTMRPSMRQALLILNGDIQLPEVPLSKPQFEYIPFSPPHNLLWISCGLQMQAPCTSPHRQTREETR